MLLGRWNIESRPRRTPWLVERVRWQKDAWLSEQHLSEREERRPPGYLPQMSRVWSSSLPSLSRMYALSELQEV